jgi:hypothetical protein
MSGTRGGGLHPVEEQFRELGEPYRVEAWAAKYEPGALDTGAAGVLADYEVRIAALERLAGWLTLSWDSHGT